MADQPKPPVEQKAGQNGALQYLEGVAEGVVRDFTDIPKAIKTINESEIQAASKASKFMNEGHFPNKRLGPIDRDAIDGPLMGTMTDVVTGGALMVGAVEGVVKAAVNEIRDRAGLKVEASQKVDALLKSDAKPKAPPAPAPKIAGP